MTRSSGATLLVSPATETKPTNWPSSLRLPDGRSTRAASVTSLCDSTERAQAYGHRLEVARVAMWQMLGAAIG